MYLAHCCDMKGPRVCRGSLEKGRKGVRKNRGIKNLRNPSSRLFLKITMIRILAVKILNTILLLFFMIKYI
jgi:hypothetical protein